jgi:hypothetical protein
MAELDSSLDPVHLVYQLSRRQRLVAHLGIWLGNWPGLLLMLICAVIITLAVLKSLWFLLILLLPPMFNNLPRFVGGLASSLLLNSQRMDIVIEQQRIGCLFGQDRKWFHLEEVTRVERFADVWVILSPDSVIDIPVSVVDEKHIAHVQAMSQQGRKAAAGGCYRNS